MQSLPSCILLLVTMLMAGCAETSFYNLETSPLSQADRYVEAEGLNLLPSKKIAITSFGIEYDTKIVYPLTGCHGQSVPGGLYTVEHFREEVTFDISRERMQLLADHAHAKLVADLKTAGYDLIPYETYKETPAYQSLIDIVGKQSPVPIAFKFGDPENLINGEALVFAPTDLMWYSPALGEVGSRVGDTLHSLNSENLRARPGLSRGQAATKAEVDLANALNATLLKVYYVVSPVRSFVETKFSEGASPVQGNTILGRGETRLAFRTPGAPVINMAHGRKNLPRDGNAFVRLTRDVQLNTALKSDRDIEDHLDAVREMLIAKLRAGK